MITKVTKDNRVQYEALFEKANQALGMNLFYRTNDQALVEGKIYYVYDNDAYLEVTEPNVANIATYYELSDSYITDLDKYFVHLKELVNGEDVIDHRLAFLRLPLDEPVFAIDTNTRAITVPGDFAKNGVSVQGDNAEVLYFSVDRYFETMDLYSDDVTIAIQWETPAAKGNPAVNGISTALFKDCIILDGEAKIVFGWAINRKITNVAGSVKFAVRFYILDANQQPKFVLNTLAQTVKIQPTIDADKFAFEQSTAAAEQEIIARLVESPVTPEESTIVDAPILRENLQESVGLAPSTGTEPETFSVDLDESSLTKALSVFATPGVHGGALSYDWTKTPLVAGEPVEVLTGSKQYVAVDDAVFSGDYGYYTNEGDEEHPAYVLLSNYTVGAAVPEELVGELYVRKNGIVAQSTGDYQVKVSAVKNGGRKEVYSNIVRIPDPGDITLVVPDNDAIQKVFLENCPVSMKVTDEQNGDKIYFSFVEQGQEDNWGTSVEVVGGEAEKQFTPEFNNETKSSFHKTFIAKVKAGRNGVFTANEAIPVREFEFAAQATKPEFVEIQVKKNGTAIDNYDAITIGNNDTIVLKAVPKLNGAYSEGLTYRWYKMVIPANEEASFDGNDIDDDTLLNSAELLESNGSNEYTIPVTSDNYGIYYCRVANIVFGVPSDECVPTAYKDTLTVEEIGAGQRLNIAHIKRG